MKWRCEPLSTRLADDRRRLHLAVHRPLVRVVDRNTVGAHDGQIAVFQIGDPVRQRRKREGIGAQDTSPCRQSRPPAAGHYAPHHQAVIVLEDDAECERTVAAGLIAVDAAFVGSIPWFRYSVIRCTETSVSVSVWNLWPLCLQLFAQLAEILDDAVVHDCDAIRRMWMRVRLVGHAMRRPARVADAGANPSAACRASTLSRPESLPGARRRSMCPFTKRRDAGGVVAAILEPLQRLQDHRRGVLLPDDADNTAHGPTLLRFRSFLGLLARTELRRPTGDLPSDRRARPRAHPSRRLLVMTLPAPTFAPSPTFTGATSVVFDPMNASAPISVKCLSKPS